MGDMGEVGDQGPQFHAEAASMRARRALRTCMRWACSRPRRCRLVAAAQGILTDMASLQAAVREALPQVGSVLVKGSRFMKMEQVVEAMVANRRTTTNRPAEAGGRMMQAIEPAVTVQGGAACC
jgi:UDP-N-acetylmuramoyl-tripeptide--D-alanyl-D-alanine ligase